MNKTKLAILVPCYNEEESLNYNIGRLKEILDELVAENIISKDSFLYFVDDGSKDKTWDLIEYAHKKYPKLIKGAKFTRNFGNQNAILAGLEGVHYTGIDCVITIDADLQQDETKVKEFILKFQQGADIVYGIRNDRDTDNFFKKIFSVLFYDFIKLMGVDLIPNHSEYRLMSKRALDMLSKYHEKNMFLRGIFREMGLQTDRVYFDVKKREYGRSKFNFLSLLRLAAWGITSFSVRPLRLIFYTGLIICLGTFSIGLIGLHRIYIQGLDQGFKSLDLFELFEAFIAGIQILSIGVIGEYIGQILQEIKARPRHLIDKELD